MSDSLAYNFGVEYLPSTVPRTEVTLDSLAELFAKNSIEFINVSWTHYTTVVHSKVLPLESFMKVLRSPRPSITLGEFSLGMVGLNISPGFHRVREYLLAFDLSTTKILPYEPGHATINGWLEAKKPEAASDGSLSVRVPLCPRTTLKRIIDEARAHAHVEFLVGFEMEFCLLEATRPRVETLPQFEWTAARAHQAGSTASKILQEIVSSLSKGGIEVLMYHTESGPGQFEIVTGPLAPLQACDALIYSRETIFNVAAKHGLRATFSPKVKLDSAGTGAHAHISLHSDDGRPKSSEALTQIESSFMAAVLDDIPSMVALSLPLPQSYTRVGDGVWSGGTYICWGTDNREAPIRVKNASSPHSRTLEMRFIDGLASPYLVIAAILGVGYRGIVSRQALTLKDCSGELSAAEMSEDERRALGIVKRLPLSWEAAREKLGSSKLLKEVLGEELVTKFLALNKFIVDSWAEESLSDEEVLIRLAELY